MATQAPIKIRDADALYIDTSATLLDNVDIRPTVAIGGPDGAAAIAPVSATDGLLVNLGANNDITVTAVPADPFGANADAAATEGGTGSMQAKLRLMTTQLAAIKTAIEAMNGGSPPPSADTATLANVSGSASSVTLQASNANRLGWEVVNDSTAILYVKYGSGASATSVTRKLEPNEAYSMTAPIYTGIITGIWGSATGAARMTELAGAFPPVDAAGTSTLANISGSASSVTLQANNANRLGLEIINDSTAIMYIKYGSAASVTSYTKKLYPQEAFSLTVRYTGLITGIWESATGAARVTELTT